MFIPCELRFFHKFLYFILYVDFKHLTSLPPLYKDNIMYMYMYMYTQGKKKRTTYF